MSKSGASPYVQTRDDTGSDESLERLPGGGLLQAESGCDLVAAEATANCHEIAEDLDVDPTPQYVFENRHVAPLAELCLYKHNSANRSPRAESR